MVRCWSCFIEDEGEGAGEGGTVDRPSAGSGKGVVHRVACAAAKGSMQLSAASRAARVSVFMFINPAPNIVSSRTKGF
jgi:hypothetical protein